MVPASARRRRPAGSIDHLIPRLKGGPAWLENELRAGRATAARARLTVGRRLTACEARGLEPNRALIVARLRELRDAIAARGGQRRARPYLDGQLRRLAA